MEFGITQYFGNYGKEKCSYCKSPKMTSELTSMDTYNLSGQSYQYLIDRGWRRSGSYCYKMIKTDCCAFYTIRCDALKFELTKSKRKLLNRMNKFLQSDSIEPTVNNMSKKMNSKVEFMDYEKEMQAKNANSTKVDFNLNNITNETIEQTKPRNYKQVNSVESQRMRTLSSGQSINVDKLKQSSKRKSKRILRRINKLINKKSCTEEDAISMMISNRKSNKIIKNKLSIEDFIDQEKNFKNNLEIKIVLATKEAGLVSHELYKKYQKIVHKSEDDELDFDKFERFLISNPFRKNKSQADWKKVYEDSIDKYGCYHMQYWLNNKLIAVNVIDILPVCISSVYFFYDPDYSFLNLGTYSSLREIELVRKLNKFNSNIKYYYMGFYIHSCIKMRYKGNINSSYLLCPKTYTYHDYKWCNKNFDLKKSCKLAMDEQIVDEDGFVNVNDVRVLFRQTAMVYKAYKIILKPKLSETNLKEKQKKVEEYAKLVGNKFIFENLLHMSE